MKKTKRENQFFLILIVLYLIVSTIWGFLPIDNSLFMQRLTILLPELIMFIPSIIFLVMSCENWKEIIRFQKIPLVVVFLLVIMTFTLIPFISLCNAFSMLFTTNLIQEEVNEMVMDHMLFGIFSMALLPAFAEEIVYRGILCQKYIKINWKKGVILSGLLFGAMHMNFNQFFYAFFMGIIFALLVEITDSILASILVHFVFNGTTVILAYVMEWAEKFMNLTETTTINTNLNITIDMIISMIPSGIFSFVISSILFILIGKITGRWQLVFSLICGKKQMEEIQGTEAAVSSEVREKIGSWHLTIGIIFCIIMAVVVEVAVRL